VGGRLNIVHNGLDKWIGTAVERKASLRWEGEEGATRTFTYGELFLEVNRCANAMRELGVTKGDRVALFMPMCPELVVAFFAVIKLGGIVLPLFSGYGADAVATRLRDAGVTLLVTADGFGAAAGRGHGASPTRLPAPHRSQHGVPRLGTEVPWMKDGSSLGGTDSAAKRCATPSVVDAEIADDPLRRATGRRKAPGIPNAGFRSAAQDMAHCFDVHDTLLMMMADIGWMMGLWNCSA
jgi:acetyl-CoA synthetase